MLSLRQLVSLLPLFLVVACAESHGTDPIPCRAGDFPPFSCIQDFGHVCGDAASQPTCTDGAWQCPGSSVPESEAECWCYGGAVDCVCRESGWDCSVDGGPPAVLDAAASGCPTDPSRAEGTPCSPEGTTCGRCTDSCGWCNLLSCNGGTWQRLEAFPPEPPCTSFDCGPELRCAAEREYCQHVLSDVGGVPDDFACRALPDGCHACDCMPDPASCSAGAEGGLTVTFGGG